MGRKGWGVSKIRGIRSEDLKVFVQIIINMYKGGQSVSTACKTQWRLCPGFSQWCWRSCQNCWNSQWNKVPSDFDPPCSTIWKLSDWHFHLIHTVTQCFIYIWALLSDIYKHTLQDALGVNTGLSILPRDALKHGKAEPGFNPLTFQLVDDGLLRCFYL